MSASQDERENEGQVARVTTGRSAAVRAAAGRYASAWGLAGVDGEGADFGAVEGLFAGTGTDSRALGGSGSPKPFDASEEGLQREGALWEGDMGTLEFDARRALLQLVRGPMLEGGRQTELWRALMNNRPAIESRLADLFLELVLDEESRVAFVRNVPEDKADVPRAVRSQKLQFVHTVMVLCLRRELLTCGYDRAFVNKADIFEQLATYRPLSKLDESAYAKRLESAWNALANAGMLQRTDTEDRFEISPVLRLVFDAEEARAASEAFDAMLAKQNEDAASRLRLADDDEDAEDEGNIEDDEDASAGEVESAAIDPENIEDREAEA